MVAQFQLPVVSLDIKWPNLVQDRPRETWKSRLSICNKKYPAIKQWGAGPLSSLPTLSPAVYANDTL